MQYRLSRTDFQGKVSFFVGNRKNAGKTSYLNLIQKAFFSDGTSAVLTIGVDGEKQDLAFGNQKPLFTAVSGSWIVSSMSSLEKSQGLFEIYDVFPWKTSLGLLVLARCLRQGTIELIGPEDNAQLGQCIKRILEHAPEGTAVFVDGAVDRKTQTSVFAEGQSIYILRGNESQLGKMQERLQLLSSFLECPISQNREAFFIHGALTVAKLDKLYAEKKIDDKTDLVLEDATKVFLSYSEWMRLTASRGVAFRQRFRIHHAVVNLENITAESFNNWLDSVKLRFCVYINPMLAEVSFDK